MDFQALKDRLEIEDLATRYAHGVDGRDWAAVDSCFAPDAEAVGTAWRSNYAAEYGPKLRKGVERFHTTMHFIGNKKVTVTADTGHMVSYGVSYHLGAGDDDMVIGVCYYDDLKRTPDGWKIAIRRVQALWTRKLDSEYKDLVRRAPG